MTSRIFSKEIIDIQQRLADMGKNLEFRASVHLVKFLFISFLCGTHKGLNSSTIPAVCSLLPPPTPCCEWAEAEIPAGIVNLRAVTAAAGATPSPGYLSDDDLCPLTCSQKYHTSWAGVVPVLLNCTFHSPNITV